MLACSAIATASTEAHTDVAPFTPQSQGINEANLADAIFMPRGNAIPIRMPIGKSVITATRMRTIVVALWKTLMA